MITVGCGEVNHLYIVHTACQQGFYEEVATPLLIDVTMSYNGGTNLTQTEFSQYYNGSEIVVAGQITDNDIGTFTPQVVAISKENVKREALELSLKYSFVTPLTSMVVTKPEGGDTEVLHKPKEGEAQQTGSRHPHIGARQGLPDVTFTQRYHTVPLFGLVHDQVPVSHRFLLKTENQSLPLCFDVTGDVRLKLLHHPTSELSVHGELDSVTNGGFRRIVIQLNADLYVDVEVNKITVREGSRMTHHTGQDPITAGSWTLIRRDKEIDVAGGDTHLVILIQGKDAQSFLWPILRQQSSDSAEGILALNPVYEEVPQTPTTNLGSKTRRLTANAADYSISPPLILDCWLLSADSALQRRLEAFIV
ncbi:hypothetical protein F7725_017026 [Dissostichus mawsoni]|uniref:Inter-alpha-trypsin inhibitor heavy chain C-terminal domain-containing protein n=1 Tax=Dissostichus mawsoni TaxID=36200 RepID=A0A7J5Z472_DISMA|nr:hypothetical protein F7725_017026 [Dissostichus mawsoni]